LLGKINEEFVTKDFIEANLEDLLKWKRIDIKLENGINKKIELKLDYVFYLLWECANESIWINLKWVKILDKENNTDHLESVWNDVISIDGISENTNWGLYVNTVGSLQQQLRAGKWSVWVWLAGGVWKHIDIPDPDQWTGTILDPNQGTGPNNGTWW
jgi:hypothetical protein